MTKSKIITLILILIFIFILSLSIFISSIFIANISNELTIMEIEKDYYKNMYIETCNLAQKEADLINNMMDTKYGVNVGERVADFNCEKFILNRDGKGFHSR